MATKELLQNAYIDYVLSSGEKPKSVYLFMKKIKLKEEDFYELYGSFEGVEQDIWTNLVYQTIEESKAQEVWVKYTSREKALSFFYSFLELLKTKRSFVTYSYFHAPKTLRTPIILKGAKEVFENMAIQIIQDGLETGELEDRRFISDKYKDALWVQFTFILKFWMRDVSAGFEKTDEAIEKGINLTFDLFARSPIDNLFDYGKFLAKNGHFA